MYNSYVNIYCGVIFAWSSHGKKDCCKVSFATKSKFYENRENSNMVSNFISYREPSIALETWFSLEHVWLQGSHWPANLPGLSGWRQKLAGVGLRQGGGGGGERC